MELYVVSLGFTGKIQYRRGSAKHGNCGKRELGDVDGSSCREEDRGVCGGSDGCPEKDHGGLEATTD